MMWLWAIAVSGLAMAAAESATPFADIPNVTLAPYDVAGRNLEAIRKAIDAARPTDPNDATRVDGLTRWAYRWSWHRDARGACHAADEDVTFSATVTVPRLVDDRASTRVREHFDRYLQSLLAHEDGHVRYAWEHRGDIAVAINAATCATAGAAAQAALKTIAAHDAAYDKATRHGADVILRLG
jgi:predicted secreted Zn-dependent protease